MGDAEKEKINILKTYNFSIMDILKVGRHDLITSSFTNFINKINSKVAVKVDNKCNHPNEEILE